MTRLHFVRNEAADSSSTEIIVFLHGLFAQGSAFATIARSLTDCASTVQVDLLNHGKSPWTADFDYLQQADAMAELLGELRDLDSVVTLVGHSMGGKVAMLTALLYPQLVDRLAVLDISPGQGGGTGEFERNANLLLGIDLAAVDRRSDADAALASDISEDMVRGFLLQNLQRDPDALSGWSWKANLQLIADQHEQVAAWPTEASGKIFNGPTLWVGGERSNYVDSDRLPQMRALFPQAKLEMLPDTGHWVHAEQPTRITALIRELVGCRNQLAG